MICGFLHAVNVKIVMDISEVWIWNISLILLLNLELTTHKKQSAFFPRSNTCE